jgi:DNA-binding PucR family transcriptional regulator
VARDGAKRGIPLPQFTRLYRFGLAELLRAALDSVARHADGAEELAAATATCSTFLLAYFDTAQTRAEAVYTEERERWLRSAEASRTDTIQAILAGRQTDAALAGQRLRHELEATHVALVAWTDQAGEEDAPVRLDAALAEAVAAFGQTGSVLIHPLGLLATAAWISRVAGAFDDQHDLRSFRVPAAAGVRIAVGRPARGLAGFRRSHEEALEARRVAMLAGRAQGSVTRYDAVALEAIATVDVAQARAFAARVLGALAADDDGTRRIAATLRVYLDEHASRSRAAQRLGIHENTVTYRIKQAQELLGRELDRDTLDLHVALRLLPVVG